MVGKIIILPFILISIGLILYDLYTGESHIIAILIFISLTVAAITMRHWVDEKWYQKNSLELGEYETQWLERFFPQFQKMPDSRKSEFKKALATEVFLKEYIPMGLEAIPEELKLMALAPAVLLELDSSKALLKHYNRIVYYKHPFLTPDIQTIHISETHHDDGVVILCIELLQASYINPSKFMNPALYEWCEIALNNDYKKIPVHEVDVHQIEEKLGMSIAEIENYFGKKVNVKTLSKYIEYC